MIILLYLSAIVASDLIIAHYGISFLPITSFFLIALDLVIRDVLHDKWREQKTLHYKMPGLILLGSVISYLINNNAKNIAIASFSAFMSAGLVSGIIYQILKDKKRLVKMNVANFFGALTDSVIFQIVAFSSINYQICTIQWMLKFTGGALWAYIYVKKKRRL